MWICLNDAFVSMVEDYKDPDYLWVRARNSDHLVNLFPYRVNIQETPTRDYRFRVHASKREMARIIADRIEGIDYGNFKNSVKDKKYHDVLEDFWHSHAFYQYQCTGKHPMYSLDDDNE